MNKQPRRTNSFRKHCLLLGLLAGMMIPGVGYAQSFTVFINGDGVDDNPGDGNCRVALGGSCTLRAAIQEANNLPGPDTISLQTDVFLNISGAFENFGNEGDLDITEDLTIESISGVKTVSAQGLDRVFHIQNGAKVTLKNLKITKGYIQGINVPKNEIPGGAGILVQGNSSLTLESVNLTYNTLSGSTSFTLTGGGLYVDALATAKITNSQIANNRGPGSGGIANLGTTEIRDSVIADNDGGSSYGGGIRNLGGYLHVGNTTISDNRATHGGGLYSSDLGLNLGNVIISNTLLTRNIASQFGGAIHNEGPITLVNSTLSDNTATGRGGGIYNSALGNMDIINSTISGNDARPDNGGRSGGGGIYNTRSISLTNVTLYDNISAKCLDVGCEADGGVGGNQLALFGEAPSVTVVNTIIADGNNSGLGTAACAGPAGYTGQIHSSGGNMEKSSDNSVSCALIAIDDIVNPTSLGLDPSLSTDTPGTTGLTPTHALTAGSVAINNGVNNACPMVDQRFLKRDDSCDIGAYEYGATESRRDDWVDLKVTIDDNVDPVKPNDDLMPLTYHVVLSNLYVNATASGFDLEVQLPGSHLFQMSQNGLNISSTGEVPVCDSPDTQNLIICTIKTLPGLGRIELFITGHPTVAADQETIVADAGASVYNDTFIANNFDREETQVDSEATGGVINYGAGSSSRRGGGTLHPLWLLTLGGLLLARRRRH